MRRRSGAWLSPGPISNKIPPFYLRFFIFDIFLFFSRHCFGHHSIGKERECKGKARPIPGRLGRGLVTSSSTAGARVFGFGCFENALVWSGLSGGKAFGIFFFIVSFPESRQVVEDETGIVVWLRCARFENVMCVTVLCWISRGRCSSFWGSEGDE